MEQTLVIIKPDGVKKGLTELDVIKGTNFTVVQRKDVISPDIETTRRHYLEHEGKPFYERITKALTSGPIIVAVISGENVISEVRKIMGRREEPNTLRGRYSNPDVMHENGIHGSDSIESAKYEISVWF
jgi:nucleoside-diphosphate kinase